MKKTQDFSDLDLVEAVRRNDRRAAELIYERHSHPVWKYIRRRIESEFDAEDIMQEIFSRFLCTTIYTIIVDARGLGPYFGRAAHNEVISFYRRQGRQPPCVPLTDQLEATDSGMNDIWFEGKRLVTILNQLSSKHRECLELFIAFGFSHQDIAELLGCSTKTVQRRMTEAHTAVASLIGTREETVHA